MVHIESGPEGDPIFNDHPFLKDVHFRLDVSEGDPCAVEGIVASSGFFTDAERNLAVELVREALVKGPASGYHFLFAEFRGDLIGYSCFGPIPCTQFSYDLYWIVVQEDFRRLGLGSQLLRATEVLVWKLGGRRIYVDTSSRPQYAPTRAFYEKFGYVRAAMLQDFYAPGDGKVTYIKVCG